MNYLNSSIVFILTLGVLFSGAYLLFGPPSLLDYWIGVPIMFLYILIVALGIITCIDLIEKKL